MRVPHIGFIVGRLGDLPLSRRLASLEVLAHMDSGLGAWVPVYVDFLGPRLPAMAFFVEGLEFRNFAIFGIWAIPRSPCAGGLAGYPIFFYGPILLPLTAPR